MYSTHTNHAAIVFKGYLLTSFTVHESFGRIRYELDSFFLKRSFIVPTFRKSFTAKHLISTYRVLSALCNLKEDLFNLLFLEKQREKLAKTLIILDKMIEMFRKDLVGQEVTILQISGRGDLLNTEFVFSEKPESSSGVVVNEKTTFHGLAENVTFFTSFEPTGEELGIMETACKLATDIDDLVRMLQMHGFFKDAKPIPITSIIDDIQQNRGETTIDSPGDIYVKSSMVFGLSEALRAELKASRFKPKLKDTILELFEGAK